MLLSSRSDATKKLDKPDNSPSPARKAKGKASKAKAKSSAENMPRTTGQDNTDNTEAEEANATQTGTEPTVKICSTDVPLLAALFAPKVYQIAASANKLRWTCPSEAHEQVSTHAAPLWTALGEVGALAKAVADQTGETDRRPWAVLNYLLHMQSNSKEWFANLLSSAVLLAADAALDSMDACKTTSQSDPLQTFPSDCEADLEQKVVAQRLFAKVGTTTAKGILAEWKNFSQQQGCVKDMYDAVKDLRLLGDSSSLLAGEATAKVEMLAKIKIGNENDDDLESQLKRMDQGFLHVVKCLACLTAVQALWRQLRTLGAAHAGDLPLIMWSPRAASAFAAG